MRNFAVFTSVICNTFKRSDTTIFLNPSTQYIDNKTTSDATVKNFV